MTYSVIPNAENRSSQHKNESSPERRRLLELMQFINFGRIERVVVKAGEPALDATTTILRTVKLSSGSANGARPEASRGDFALKHEVRELFRQFDQLRDGVIEKIEVVHGLPHLMVIAAPIISAA